MKMLSTIKQKVLHIGCRMMETLRTLVAIPFEWFTALALVQNSIKIFQTWKQANKAMPKQQEVYTEDELEFMPAALEVLETPASPLGRTLIYVLVSVFCIALLWSIFGRMDMVVVSTGKLSPDGYVKTVQSVNSGTVQRIYVKNGDTVSVGQDIIKLRDTQESIAKNKAYALLKVSTFEVQYYTALWQNLSGKKVDGAIFSALPEKERILYKNRLQSELTAYSKTIGSLTNKIYKIQTEILINKSDIEKLRGDLDVATLEYEANQKLLQQKLTSMLALKKSRQKKLGFEKSISSKYSLLKELNFSLRSLQADLDKVKSSFKSETVKNLLSAQDKLKQAKLNYASSITVFNQAHIVSPIEGTVQQLQVHTIGGVIKSGEAVAVIVPHDTPLRAEVLIKNQDIGFVKLKQNVKVKINSFPFTKYGYLTGKVVFISKDSINNKILGPVYQAYVTLDSQTLNIDGKPVKLTSGMTVSGEIKTGKRRIIEYILSPLLKAKDEAFRER